MQHISDTFKCKRMRAVKSAESILLFHPPLELWTACTACDISIPHYFPVSSTHISHTHTLTHSLTHTPHTMRTYNLTTHDERTHPPRTHTHTQTHRRSTQNRFVSLPTCPRRHSSSPSPSVTPWPFPPSPPPGPASKLRTKRSSF